MKKLIVLVLAVSVLAFSLPVSAKNLHHDWSGKKYGKHRWHEIKYEDEDRGMPFRWYEKHDRWRSSQYSLERIHDRQLEYRLPGLIAYKWHDNHGEGFWYKGRYVKDAVLLFNSSDELVAVGLKHDNTFILIRDDWRSFESRDSFFISLWIH